MAIPLWLLKYLFVLVGFGIFFTEHEAFGLILGIIGVVWCIFHWAIKEE